MAKLKIVLSSGDTHELQITPAIEVAFEAYAKKGLHKAFREDEKQTDVYWLAWKTLQMNGVTVKPFDSGFLDQLTRVEVLDDDPLD
jgi:hypothetical protein